MGLIDIAVSAVFAITALVLHELAHIFAVNYLGGKVERVRPFPLGLMARFRGLERLCAWERYVIYGAGSFANAVVAAWAFSVSYLSYFGVLWLERLAFFNLVLCIFNLLPVLPLDGGRILRQFLANRIGVLRANRVLLRLGAAVSLCLMILGMVQVILYNYNVTLLCAAIYIRRQNRDMKPTLQMEFFQVLAAKRERTRARLVPVKKVEISESASVKYAMERLTMDYFTEFCFYEGGALHEIALIEHVLEDGVRGRVGDV